jgi:hypothetical protein
VLEGPSLILAIALAVVLAVAPWIYLSWASQSFSAETSGSSRSQRNGSGSKSVTEEGEWGELEVTDIVISPPLEFVQLLADTRESDDWHFRNATKEQVDQFFRQMPIDEATRQTLMRLARPLEEYDGVVITPPAELIWNLSPEARGALYNALALDTLNFVQGSAFRFEGTLEEWLSGVELSSETVELVKKLLYRHNDSIFLADTHVLLPRLPKVEQTRLLKALSGQRTLALRLRVTADDNITELVEYWGRGRRSKDVRPILESLAKVPGGGTIDVAHLLPQFARTRLYTYATPTKKSSDAMIHNCLWTSLNFFGTAPEDRFTDLKAALEEIETNYYPIYRNPKLGDLVVFSDQADPLFHAAIYVADDILYTKNGNSFSLPWMYMRLEQLKDFYARPLPVRISYYRHNDL